MYDELMEFLTREELLDHYDALRQQGIFKKSWKKDEIARAIAKHLESLGFKPYRCYCGTSFDLKDYKHVMNCPNYKKLEGKFRPSMVSTFAGPDFINYGGIRRQLRLLFHEPRMDEIIKIEHAAKVGSIEKTLQPCTCGEKVQVIQIFPDRNMILTKCSLCVSIRIVDND